MVKKKIQIMKKEYQILTKNELRDTQGGFLLAGLGIMIAYTASAAAFIYNMGKDGKSGVSKEGAE